MLIPRLILERTARPLSWILILLDFLWELPQNLLGLVLALVNGFSHVSRETLHDGRVTVFTWSLNSGISLGWFQIVPETASTVMTSHEVGHSKQSVRLGWLYLFVIGIPSIIWAGLMHRHTGRSYYWFYTERWADRLAGMEDR